MIVDSSALVALLFDEPQAAALSQALLDDPVRLVGTPTSVEVALVVDGRLPGEGERVVRSLLDEYEVATVAFTSTMAAAAIGAWARFGKGNHPARLNFGDCLTYGVAEVHGEPILCIGNDFVQTDAAIVPLN